MRRRANKRVNTGRYRKRVPSSRGTLSHSKPRRWHVKPARVTHVIVDGRLLYRNGELVTLDEEEITAEVQRRVAKFAR